MSISPYLSGLRDRVGHQLLMVPSVAALIRNPEAEILLQRTASGVWSVPAGAIDPGEAPAQAVVREVREETGLHVRPCRIVGVFGGNPGFRYTYSNGDEVEYLCVLFDCEVLGGALVGQDDETIELRFFPFEEMPSLAVAYPRELFSGSHPESHFQWNDLWLGVGK